MKIPAAAWVVAGGLAFAVALFLVLHKGGASDSADAEPQVTAAVTLAPVRPESLATVVRAYGSIQPAADAAVTVAAPKAAVITRLMVGMGQQVRAGQPLVEIANAPATQQAYRQAADAVAFAEADLVRLQRLLSEHLATNDQLSAAEKTLADARAALAAQQAQGAGRTVQTLVAPSAAVVTGVQVKAGDRVAQDFALLTLARAGALVADLSVQSDQAGSVAPGDAAAVTSAFGGPTYPSQLATVGRLSDPTLRSIHVVAPVPATAFPISAAVQADITVGTHKGLVAPRAAVVFDETGTHLFTISGGKAHRVFVKVAADRGQDLEVSGPISAGQMVAVQGAYELQDGMSVRTAGQ